VTRALPRRLYWVILHLTILLAFSRYFVAPLVDREEVIATDFTVFYTGWSLVLSDPAHTYDVDAQRRVQGEIMGSRRFKGGVMTFYYPPHAALALAPFAKLGFQNAFRLWTALQLGCLLVLVRWLWGLAGLRERLDRWVLATAVLAFTPVLYTLQIGQLSIAMTLALVGFWRAFDRRCDWQAGLWLLVLTTKPHLLIVPLLLLVASRRWRPCTWAALWGAPLLIAATLVLGPRVWLDYPAHVKVLENFVAGGSHDHMLNLRGFITRLVGPDHDATIFRICAAAFALGCVAIYRLLRGFAARGAVPPVAFGAAVAVGLPVAMHLHFQDAIVWAVPLVVFAAHLGVATSEGRRFASFALAWPILYVVTLAAERASGRLLLVPPPLVLAVILAGWMLRSLSVERTRAA
jgi:hypothetical protein